MSGVEDRTGSPYGPLRPLGGQWAEARGFLRTYGSNPYAQAELVKALSGLWRNADEEWRPNQECRDGIENVVVAESLKNVIRFMREQLPEWASLEPISLDSDFMLPDYPGCDPHLKAYVEEEILEGDFDRAGIA